MNRKRWRPRLEKLLSRLHPLSPRHEVGGPKLAGLIPLLVGVAMLVYVYVLSPRTD